MMYLNDVEEGGETAFPMAGEDSYDPDVSCTYNKSRFKSVAHELYPYTCIPLIIVYIHPSIEITFLISKCVFSKTIRSVLPLRGIPLRNFIRAT